MVSKTVSKRKRRRSRKKKRVLQFEYLRRSNEDIHEAVNEWCENPKEAIKKYGHISNWITTNVTNMTGLFRDKQQFNDNIGNWDVSNVTNMSCMFSFASSFNKHIGNWDVSNVETMVLMFRNSYSFNHYIGLWKVDKVKSFNNMFFRVRSFNQDLRNWKISKTACTMNMFDGAEKMNIVNKPECNNDYSILHEPNFTCDIVDDVVDTRGPMYYSRVNGFNFWN